jgi:Thioredoxin-like
MAHNQEMIEKRGKDWGKNVRLIGLSIDQDVQKLKSHVVDKKWTSVEHYHVRNGTCTADKDFGVQGVPHVLLVDTNGKIVFVGHPASRDIEKDIDSLLKGETLSGEGTGKSAESQEN